MNLEYVLTGLIRRYVPEYFLFAIMKLRGDSSLGERNPDEYFKEWQKQLDMHSISLRDKRILDVGSGRYARFSLRMLAAGAQHITLIDLYATSLDDHNHREQLKRDCEILGLNILDVLPRIKIIRGNFTDQAIPSIEDQVDIVMSSTVLEHVREPTQVLTDCYAWLKPGGITCHFIDLRDHNLSFRYPFEMLTFSDRVWKRWFDLKGGFHLNRWRVPDYLEAMHQAHFESVSYDVAWRDRARLQQIIHRLDRRFRDIPLDMLEILGMYLYGRKSLHMSQ